MPVPSTRPLFSLPMAACRRWWAGSRGARCRREPDFYQIPTQALDEDSRFSPCARICVSLQDHAESLPFSARPKLAICPLYQSFLASSRVGSDRENNDWHSNKRRGHRSMWSPQPFLLPFVPLPGKQSQHPPGLPSGYSCPHLQAGPGCTWPSTRTPWRATCGCSRRTWACCISTMSSECAHGLSHVAPELASSLAPKSPVTSCHMQAARCSTSEARPGTAYCGRVSDGQRAIRALPASRFGALPLPDPLPRPQIALECSAFAGAAAGTEYSQQLPRARWALCCRPKHLKTLAVKCPVAPNPGRECPSGVGEGRVELAALQGARMSPVRFQHSRLVDEVGPSWQPVPKPPSSPLVAHRNALVCSHDHLTLFLTLVSGLEFIRFDLDLVRHHGSHRGWGRGVRGVGWARGFIFGALLGEPGGRD